jgi:hypothetical protein
MDVVGHKNEGVELAVAMQFSIPDGLDYHARDLRPAKV